MRILHFSDVHVGIPLHEVPVHKWFGKRAIGGLNLLAGRRRFFADAPAKLAALDRFRREQQIDLVLFTGDYTALGLPQEFAAARSAVQPLMTAPLGFVNVPGNHDLYVADAVRARGFERQFGDTLESDVTDYRNDGPWPLVRLVGDHVAVVAVNSAGPNPLPWRSSGKIPGDQLRALRDLLVDDRLRGRFLFVMTHYAPRLGDGRPDHGLHGMVNAEAFLAACAGIPRGVILCGHVHRRFHVRVPGVTPGIFCAGSATMANQEGLWVFDLDGPGEVARATPGRWDGARYDLQTAETVVCSDLP